MTTEARRLRAREALDRAIAEYEADGYTVSLEEQLGFPDGNIRADAVARRDDETVVIEVRSADLSDRARNRLAHLAEIVSAQHGWRVDLVTYQPVAQPLVPQRDDVLRRVAEARSVFGRSPEAAVMLIWSAIEGALLRLSQRRGLGPTRPVPPRTLIRQLTVDGMLTDSQADELYDLALIRRDIAHGMQSALPKRKRLEWLCQLALALSAHDDDVVSVDEMIEWFRANYATPEEAALFYDKEEGEYFWFGTGPHDADEVLRDQFETAPESAIAEAVRVITDEGWDWARRDQL